MISLKYNQFMKHIVQFQVYKSEKFFVANGVDLPIVTQGETLDELVKNIREAVDLLLEGENLADFDLAEKPHVMINMEVPDTVYA